MQTTDTYPERPDPPADPHPRRRGEREHRTIRRWRQRIVARKRARLVSRRSRHAIARRLCDIARDANDRDSIRRRHDVLLHYRAAAVRTDLLEIAALLERSHDPDPACVRALKELLMNGDSPLYHPGVPAAQLQATLDYVRVGLTPDHTISVGLEPHPTDQQEIERGRADVVRAERTKR